MDCSEKVSDPEVNPGNKKRGNVLRGAGFHHRGKRTILFPLGRYVQVFLAESHVSTAAVGLNRP